MIVLEAANIGYTYPMSRTAPVLVDCSLSIEEGESVGIVGRNGSGKSTLLKILATLLRPTTGTVKYRGKPINSAIREYRSKLNYCSGAPQGFYPRLTARENLHFFSGMRGRAYDNAEIDSLLVQVDLIAAADTAYGQFSLGMRQRLHLACLMLEPSDIWIADEPTNGLDVDGLSALEQILTTKQRKTLVVVSHDQAFLERVTSRRIVLDQGVTACSGFASS